ncbi:hypothetical protein PG988_008427 [Apiospora saccharicola]
MSKAYLKAKEKYNEIINDAGRGDWYCKPTTPLPSKGKCDVVAHVAHPPSRRGSTGSMSDKIKDWMNRPAY